MKLTEHFTLAEMAASQTATRFGIPNKPGAGEIANMTALCQHVLEPLRAHFGKPVIVSSGYRAPAVNSAVGGSATSQHVKGEASDIGVVGVPHLTVAKYIRDNLPFDQLIMEGGWVHVSYRASGNRKSVLTAHFAPGKATRYTKGL